MSKQANTKLIGGFVVGAVALIVVGLLVFGSGKLLSKHKEFVLYFSDSVAGLNVGAPVDFRGVKIGTVTDIKVVLDKKNLALQIPVYIEIDPGKVSFGGTGVELENIVKESKNGATFLQLLINRGLRAQLSMQSLITGQLGIHLDFFPGTPVRLVHTASKCEEIPTIESPFAAIAKTVQKIPLSQIADKLLDTLDTTEKIIASPQISGAIDSLAQTVKTANLFLANLNRQVEPLAKSAKLNLVESKKMFTNAARLSAKLNADIPGVVAQLNKTLKAAGVTMKGANNTLDGFNSDNSPVRVQLLSTLNELASAARSLRILADYLDQHPEALVRGKVK